MTQDLRTVLLRVSKQLTSENVGELNFFFGRNASEVSSNAPLELFNFLINHGIISDQNVSKLVEALNTIALGGATKDLLDYEKKLGISPSGSSRNDVFVGRIEELDDMQFHLDDIKGGNHGFRAIFVTGLPGIGKTYLVEEFQRRESDTKFFNRMFISCRGLKKALGVKNFIMEHFRISIERHNLFKIFERTLQSWPNTMVILDNLEEVMEHDAANFDHLILDLCDASRRVRQRSHCLLMTSRRRLSDDVKNKLGDTLLPLSLENMNEEDSLELLESYLGNRNLSTEEMKKLMTLCGQHTLSMALVASRLKLSPNVPFDMVADEMKRRPLIALTNIEEMDILPSRSCVENSLYNTFESMNFESQDLLIRLAVAADSIKESTARNLYRDNTSSVRDAFPESLTRLLEINFVKCREYTQGDTRRFFIHLLIRCFVTKYCNHPDCSSELKTTYEEAQEMLRTEYIREMKQLSRTEWESPSRYNRDMEAERHNFLPQVPQILDTMVTESASLNDLDRVCEVSRHLFNAPKERANLIMDRKKVAVRNKAPAWAVAFFELLYADEIRLSGNHERAAESFERVRSLLDARQGGMTAEQRAWLDAHYDRYYGRYLKDQTRGDYKRAMKKAVRYLKNAREKFKNEVLFYDVQKYMAEVHYDLGNALKIYGDNDMCERGRLYSEAREAFDAARCIYEKANPRIVHLFDVYLSLAACDMELKSLLRSVDGREDKVSLSPAIEFYNKAETVAKANPDVIEKNDEKMGYMHYSRAVCNTRARNYLDAYGDAQQALRRRLNALGCHNQTMSCYILLGDIYSRDARLFTRHNRRAKESFEKALDVAQRLAWKGSDVRSSDLERLLNHFIMICSRLELDYKKYQVLIKAVERRDLAKLEPDKQENEIGSDEDMEHCKRLKNATVGPSEYRDSSSDSDADSEDGSAPKCSAARDLSDQLNELMKKNAERLKHLSHVMDVVDMEILVSVLHDGYPNMPPAVRNARYEKGEMLYSHLIKLENNPGSVIEESEKARKGAKRSRR